MVAELAVVLDGVDWVVVVVVVVVVLGGTVDSGPHPVTANVAATVRVTEVARRRWWEGIASSLWPSCSNRGQTAPSSAG